MDQFIYYVGLAVCVLLCAAAVLVALAIVAVSAQRLMRNIYVEAMYGDYDDWNAFRQFRKKYHDVHRMCPHCGGSGACDDDDDTRRELAELRKITQRPTNRLNAYLNRLRKKQGD